MYPVVPTGITASLVLPVTIAATQQNGGLVLQHIIVALNLVGQTIQSVVQEQHARHTVVTKLTMPWAPNVVDPVGVMAPFVGLEQRATFAAKGLNGGLERGDIIVAESLVGQTRQPVEQEQHVRHTVVTKPTMPWAPNVADHGTSSDC